MSRRNILALAAAVSATLLAAAAPAEAQSLIPKAAPKGAAPAEAPSEAQAKAWVAANLDTRGWIYAGHDEDGVMFVAEAVRGDDIMELDVRFEHFKPDVSDGVALRSMRVVYEIDCRSARMREVQIDGYSLNGLKGEEQEASHRGDWSALTPGGNGLEDYILGKCDEALAALEPKPVEGPASLARPDVDAWIARTLKPAGDAWLYYDSAGAAYVHGGARRTAPGTYAFAIRLELFEPVDGARSRRYDMELDCLGHRARFTAMTLHDQHNLAGAGKATEGRGDWISPAEPEDAIQADRTCDVVKALAEG